MHIFRRQNVGFLLLYLQGLPILQPSQSSSKWRGRQCCLGHKVKCIRNITLIFYSNLNPKSSHYQAGGIPSGHLGTPSTPRVVTRARKGKGLQPHQFLCWPGHHSDQRLVRLCAWGVELGGGWGARCHWPSPSGPLLPHRSDYLSRGRWQIPATLFFISGNLFFSGRTLPTSPCFSGALCHFLKLCPGWQAQDLGTQNPRRFRLVAFHLGTFLSPASTGEEDNLEKNRCHLKVSQSLLG